MSVIQCNCYVFKYYYFDCVWKLPSQNSHWKNNNKHCAYFSSPTLQCAYFFLDFKCSMCLALCLFFSPFRVYRAYKDVLIKRNRCTPFMSHVKQNHFLYEAGEIPMKPPKADRKFLWLTLYAPNRNAKFVRHS